MPKDYFDIIDEYKDKSLIETLRSSLKLFIIKTFDLLPNLFIIVGFVYLTLLIAQKLNII